MPETGDGKDKSLSSSGLPSPASSLRYCMSDAELRQLDEYVIKMDALIQKYECEITIINGGTCRHGRSKP